MVVKSGTEVRGMRLEVRKPKSLRSYQTLDPKPQTLSRLALSLNLVFSLIFARNLDAKRRNEQPLFARGAELASRSDTGLRKQTGEGEAFTGGGKYLPPKMESVPIFRPALPCPRDITLSLLLAVRSNP